MRSKLVRRNEVELGHADFVDVPIEYAAYEREVSVSWEYVRDP